MIDADLSSNSVILEAEEGRFLATDLHLSWLRLVRVGTFGPTSGLSQKTEIVEHTLKKKVPFQAEFIATHTVSKDMELRPESKPVFHFLSSNTTCFLQV